jgi:hypothetical protein
MKYEDYYPIGSTALYDAMGVLLEEKINFQSKGKHILIILTDGEENSSFHYTKSKVQELVKSKKEIYGLEVLYLGSNQDAIFNGESIGASQKTTLLYEDENIEHAMRSASQTIKRYHTGESQTLEFLPVEREVSLNSNTY